MRKTILHRGCAKIFTRADCLEAARDPDAYWAKAAARVVFSKPWQRVSPDPGTLSSGVGQWFAGGELNVTYNAVDRHAATQPNKVALYYDSPVSAARTKRRITYDELLEQVVRVARVLREEFGVACGDTVILYMPNVPEAVFTMLACARLGAVHSVVFGGFSPTELSKRILDSGAAVVVCSNCGLDGAKVLNYKRAVDEAIALLPNPAQVRRCGVWIRPELSGDVPWIKGRDANMNNLVREDSGVLLPSSLVPCVAVPSEHPFYLLYTSGTTGVPKGICRETAGTTVMLANAMERFLGIGSDDVVFTASDIGWIVGTNFIVYAPLLAGCSSVLYEGKPVGTPDAGSFFRLVEEYRVNAIFTAPTAIRAIRRVDPNGACIRRYDTSSLERFYLAGERTDPHSAHWIESELKVPVIDNWWQTETASPITSSPRNPETGEIERRAGSCGIAMPGWRVKAVDTEIPKGDEGSGISGELVLELPLPPGALSCIWGRPSALKELYFNRAGQFCTFDAGEVSPDGFVTVMARTDDIINVAGHRLSTGQMEGALCEHDAVAEAAVVGIPCGLKGETPLGIVVATAGASPSAAELEAFVRQRVGAIAVIRVVIVDQLPKTRSGKVLRKTLRQIASKKFPVDVPPTIEDADVVSRLWERINGAPMPTTG